MRAGVFDSGVGGLSVVKSLLEHHLFDEIVYYGDTARVPYGVKDPSTIIRYSLEALEFFKNFDIDVMICACNSVSAHAIAELRSQAPFPVFGVIKSGVIALTNKAKDKNANILVLGTKATIKSQKYQNMLIEKGFKNITSVAPSLFVPIVEEEIYSGALLDETMKHYFKDIKDEPDFVILGCTHFPLIQKKIGEYFPKATLIHSGEAIVEYLEKELSFRTKPEQTTLKLFATESPETLKKVASNWLGCSGVLL